MIRARDPFNLNLIYNHLSDAFFLHRLCSRRSAGYWFAGYGLQISKGCVFFCTICALVGRLVVGLLVRLQ